jgi:hypothetical protein
MRIGRPTAAAADYCTVGLARAEPMDQRPDPAVIARLRTHYSADAALLERLVGPVPGVTDVT